MKQFGQLFYIYLTCFLWLSFAAPAQARDLTLNDQHITLSNIQMPDTYKDHANLFIQSWLKTHPRPHIKDSYPNRFGEISAIITTGPNLQESLQEALLTAGLAFYFPTGIKTDILPLLRQAEAYAINAQANIWSQKNIILAQANITRTDLHKWQIVTGVIHSAVKRGSVIYLNFGENWQHDFTVKLQSPATRKLLKWHPELSILKGRNIRIRGWLHTESGPMITTKNITHLDILPIPPKL